MQHHGGAGGRIAAGGGAPRRPGAQALLIKGGGLQGLRGSDVLWSQGTLLWLRTAPIDTPHSHGSGCTLSAAITAELARGAALEAAIRTCKAFMAGGLRHALAIGGGQGPLCHWHQALGEGPEGQT